MRIPKKIMFGYSNEFYLSLGYVPIDDTKFTFELNDFKNAGLDFTKKVKNISEDEKKIIIEALWKIIYSDENADVYETNLMRRLSGLLYLDNKVVGDIKEKVKQNL